VLLFINSYIKPLYAKTSGTGMVLWILIYLRVAASLANDRRFVPSDLIGLASLGEQRTYYTPSSNVIKLAQWKLSHAGICEGS